MINSIKFFLINIFIMQRIKKYMIKLKHWVFFSCSNGNALRSITIKIIMELFSYQDPKSSLNLFSGDFEECPSSWYNDNLCSMWMQLVLLFNCFLSWINMKYLCFQFVWVIVPTRFWKHIILWEYCRYFTHFHWGLWQNSFCN